MATATTIGKITPAAKTQSGYDIVTSTALELVGVGLLALLASTSNDMGTIVVIIMAGFMVGWGIANSGWLITHLGSPTGIDPIFKPYTG
jgi:hypothetical protein